MGRRQGTEESQHFRGGTEEKQLLLVGGGMVTEMEGKPERQVSQQSRVKSFRTVKVTDSGDCLEELGTGSWQVGVAP